VTKKLDFYEYFFSLIPCLRPVRTIRDRQLLLLINFLLTDSLIKLIHLEYHDVKIIKMYFLINLDMLNSIMFK